MTHDFSRQTLRGRRFRHQDLSGANFREADIQGADFSYACLTKTLKEASQTVEAGTHLWETI